MTRRHMTGLSPGRWGSSSHSPKRQLYCVLDRGLPPSLGTHYKEKLPPDLRGCVRVETTLSSQAPPSQLSHLTFNADIRTSLQISLPTMNRFRTYTIEEVTSLIKTDFRRPTTSLQATGSLLSSMHQEFFSRERGNNICRCTAKVLNSFSSRDTTIIIAAAQSKRSVDSITFQHTKGANGYHLAPKFRWVIPFRKGLTSRVSKTCYDKKRSVAQKMLSSTQVSSPQVS